MFHSLNNMGMYVYFCVLVVVFVVPTNINARLIGSNINTLHDHHYSTKNSLQRQHHRKLVTNDIIGIDNQYIVLFSDQYIATSSTTMLIRDKIRSYFVPDATTVDTNNQNIYETMNSNFIKLRFRDGSENEKDDNRQLQDTDSIEDDNTTIEIIQVYDDTPTYKGFVVSKLRFPKLLDRILNDDDVVLVEQDTYIQPDVPLPADGSDEDSGSTVSSSSLSHTPWGLDRIDQPSLPLDNQQFELGTYTGAGVDVYVLDAGIRPTHEEFDGRIACGLDVLASSTSSSQSCSDGSGHGTHVAGIIGGKTYGVAKDVRIVSVRVLDKDGNGMMSAVIRGVTYVMKQKQSTPSTPVILNMSLGGGSSQALSAAVTLGSDSYNIHFIVSAGNGYRWACSQSPANSEEAITVGATTITDNMALYSNWGQCVDIFAPGTNIQSAWIGSDTNALVQSGTSMAAPFVAGAAALHLQRNPELTPSELKQELISDSISDVIDRPLWAAGTPNNLVNVQSIVQST